MVDQHTPSFFTSFLFNTKFAFFSSLFRSVESIFRLNVIFSSDAPNLVLQTADMEMPTDELKEELLEDCSSAITTAAAEILRPSHFRRKRG